MRGGWLTTVYNIYMFVNQSKWKVFGGLQGESRAAPVFLRPGRRGRAAFFTFCGTPCLNEKGAKSMAGEQSPIPVEQIEHAILLIRGQKVMLDSDLATLSIASKQKP